MVLERSEIWLICFCEVCQQNETKSRKHREYNPMAINSLLICDVDENNNTQNCNSVITDYNTSCQSYPVKSLHEHLQETLRLHEKPDSYI